MSDTELDKTIEELEAEVLAEVLVDEESGETFTEDDESA